MKTTDVMGITITITLVTVIVLWIGLEIAKINEWLTILVFWSFCSGIFVGYMLGYTIAKERGEKS